MQAFFITLGVFLLAVAAMAVGVIFSNRRIKGSCGGLANFQDGSGRPMCDLCSHPSPDCTGDPAKEDCPQECLEPAAVAPGARSGDEAS